MEAWTRQVVESGHLLRASERNVTVQSYTPAMIDMMISWTNEFTLVLKK